MEWLVFWRLTLSGPPATQYLRPRFKGRVSCPPPLVCANRVTWLSPDCPLISVKVGDGSLNSGSCSGSGKEGDLSRSLWRPSLSRLKFAPNSFSLLVEVYQDITDLVLSHRSVDFILVGFDITHDSKSWVYNSFEFINWALPLVKVSSSSSKLRCSIITGCVSHSLTSNF